MFSDWKVIRDEVIRLSRLGGKNKGILQDSQNRVLAMAMIHEVLYRSNSLSSIDMQGYLSKIVGVVFQSYGDIDQRVNHKIETDNIQIGAKQATPLGIIVNELATNTAKYAFPENKKGEFSVHLNQVDDNRLVLIAADGGRGFPEGFNWRDSDSLGMKLVKLIVENQLGGTISIEGDKGTKFNIKFSIEETKENML